MHSKLEVVQSLYEVLFKYKFFKKVEFKKGDVITTYIKNRNYIFFLLNGSANLVRNNHKDIIIDSFRKNSLFCEDFVYIKNSQELSLVASKDGEIVLFTYQDIINSNISNEKKLNIINIIFNLLSFEIKNKNERMEILANKTTRDKLLHYFKLIYSKKNSPYFNIDISYSELALYLCVDRSAMMRELKYLEDDGIIKKEGRSITFLI